MGGTGSHSLRVKTETMKKSKISAEIIADSKNEQGGRITTFVLTFPRFILAELNTHRMFSRNSASSRAIPFKKMVEKCKNDPFIPIAWQKDHSGMQGTEYLKSGGKYSVTERDGVLGYTTNPVEEWLNARDSALNGAWIMNQMDVTKQICNRLLEPFMWHTAIVTATEFENFFKQRCPQYQFADNAPVFRSKSDCMEFYNDDPDFWKMMDDYNTVDWLKINKGQGEIHIMELAEKMWDAMNYSKPKELKAGEWHIPFGDRMDINKIKCLLPVQEPMMIEENRKEVQDVMVKIATARCARVSYMNFDGTDDYAKDIALHDRLIKMRHNSPFEHLAQAMTSAEYEENVMGSVYDEDRKVLGWSGNLQGFIQYRKKIRGEDGRN